MSFLQYLNPKQQQITSNRTFIQLASSPKFNYKDSSQVKSLVSKRKHFHSFVFKNEKEKDGEEQKRRKEEIKSKEYLRKIILKDSNEITKVENHINEIKMFHKNCVTQQINRKEYDSFSRYLAKGNSHVQTNKRKNIKFIHLDQITRNISSPKKLQKKIQDQYLDSFREEAQKIRNLNYLEKFLKQLDSEKSRYNQSKGNIFKDLRTNRIKSKNYNNDQRRQSHRFDRTSSLWRHKQSQSEDNVKKQPIIPWIENQQLLSPLSGRKKHSGMGFQFNQCDIFQS